MFAFGYNCGSAPSPLSNRFVAAGHGNLAEAAIREAVGRLDERRRVEGVIDGRRERVHPRIRVVGVVESGNRSRRRPTESLLARVLRRHSEVRVDLIIAANRRLITERLERRRQEFEVVVGAGRLRDVRRRPELQNIEARLIQPVLRNPAQHSAVLETPAVFAAVQGDVDRGSRIRLNRLPLLSRVSEKSPCRSSAVGTRNWRRMLAVVRGRYSCE